MTLRLLALTAGLALAAACGGTAPKAADDPARADRERPDKEARPGKEARSDAPERAEAKGRAGRKGADDDRSKPDIEGPNVLLVVWDTVRSDRLSTYGYGRETTPRLTAFAEDAVVYERAVSPGMWTIPSHASIFTGMPVSAHGASANHKWLDARFTTMAEWFGDKGYDTYLFAANPFVAGSTNLSQGFDKTEVPWGKRWRAAAREATMGKLYPQDASNSLGPAWKQGKMASGRGADNAKDSGPVTAEALMTWIGARKDADRPFLAVLNYMEAHVPRVPSKEAREALFDKATIRRQLTTNQDITDLLSFTVGVLDFDAERIDTVSTTYDAALRDLDTATGVLFDKLAEAGILEDTIVIVTADHGEHLGEHHKFGHKYSVGNPLIHVPLIVRYPKAMPPGRVDQVVSTLNIFATAADLAGLDMPPGTLSRSLRDLDALPDQAVAELMEPTPHALKRVSKQHDFSWKPFLHTYTAVEEGTRKCIERDDGRRQLYAMPDDFLETRDLSGDEREVARSLCGVIGPWRESFEAYDAGKRGAADEAGDDMDEEMKRSLAALGYLEEVELDEEGREVAPKRGKGR